MPQPGEEGLFILISSGYLDLPQDMASEHNQEYGLLREAPFYLLAKLYTSPVSMKLEQKSSWRLSI
jgi:hypothetical protein